MPQEQNSQSDIIQDAINTIRSLKAEREKQIEKINALEEQLCISYSETERLKLIIQFQNLALAEFEEKMKSEEKKQALIDELKKEIATI